MNELSVPWSLEESQHIEIELDKLFMLQDRPLPEKKKSFFATELSASGLPYKSVLGGINKLKTEDLKTLKISTILDAAKEMFEPLEPEEDYSCEFCNGRGRVLMRDAQKYVRALACICRNKFKAKGLTPWNGLSTQSEKGKVLSSYFEDGK